MRIYEIFNVMDRQDRKFGVDFHLVFFRHLYSLGLPNTVNYRSTCTRMLNVSHINWLPYQTSGPRCIKLYTINGKLDFNGKFHRILDADWLWCLVAMAVTCVPLKAKLPLMVSFMQWAPGISSHALVFVRDGNIFTIQRDISAKVPFFTPKNVPTHMYIWYLLFGIVFMLVKTLHMTFSWVSQMDKMRSRYSYRSHSWCKFKMTMSIFFSLHAKSNVFNFSIYLYTFSVAVKIRNSDCILFSGFIKWLQYVYMHNKIVLPCVINFLFLQLSTMIINGCAVKLAVYFF